MCEETDLRGLHIISKETDLRGGPHIGCEETDLGAHIVSEETGLRGPI